jgi:hypothetical protein
MKTIAECVLYLGFVKVGGKGIGCGAEEKSIDCASCSTDGLFEEIG